MKLILNKSEFEHKVDRSFYNNNIYQNTKNKYLILEVCDEDYNTYTFYLLEPEGRIFLGCANSGFGCFPSNIEIDFKTQYT